MSHRGIVAAAALAFAAAPAIGQTYTPLPLHTSAPAIVGVIDESDPLDDQGRRYDEYILEIETTHSIWITVETASDSRIFSVVELYAPGGQTPVAASDARGGNPSSGIDFTAFQPGTYRIRVLGGGGSAGRYILRMAIDPRDEGGPILDGSSAPPPARPPAERFIVCPGHPRCPRLR